MPLFNVLIIKQLEDTQQTGLYNFETKIPFLGFKTDFK
jgi:hypothetical protein